MTPFGLCLEGRFSWLFFDAARANRQVFDSDVVRDQMLFFIRAC